MLELKDDQEVEFANKIVGLAKAAGCQVNEISILTQTIILSLCILKFGVDMY